VPKKLLHFSVSLAAAIGLVFISGCASSSAESSFTYADGNGNRYIINVAENRSIEYVPIQPKDSSSGVYSGGEYVKKQISQEEYSQIRGRLQAAIDNRSIHIEFREMGSGLIAVKETGKEHLIASGSPEQKNIEEFLTKLVQGK
jgi:hypothetical protein